MSMENSNDIIGNRTLELPTCNAVPQSIAPPGATIFLCKGKKSVERYLNTGCKENIRNYDRISVSVG